MPIAVEGCPVGRRTGSSATDARLSLWMGMVASPQVIPALGDQPILCTMTMIEGQVAVQVAVHRNSGPIEECLQDLIARALLACPPDRV